MKTYEVNNKIEKNNRLIIGVPMSPSTRVSAEGTQSTEILYSYGGGLSGKMKTIYTDKVIPKEEFNNRFVEVTTVQGETLTIQSDYIVTFKNVILVVDTINVTAHSDYRKKVINSAIYVRYIKLEPNQTWELSDKYDNNKIESVYSFTNKN